MGAAILLGASGEADAQGSAPGVQALEEAEHLNTEIMALFTAGKYDKAIPMAERALALREKALGADHPHMAQSLNNLAGLYTAQGNAAAAIPRMVRAAAIEERNAAIQLASDSDEQKRLYMETLQGSTEATVSLHARSFPTSAEAARLALTTILRRKGRVLEAMTDILAALRRRLDPGDQALLDRLRSVTAQLGAQISRGPGHISLEQYRANLALLDKQRQELEGEVSQRSPAFLAVRRPVTLEEVQAAIHDEAALVEIYRYTPLDPKAPYAQRWGKPRYVAYLLRQRGAATWTDLGEAEPIDAAVDTLRGALARRSSKPEAAARALDAMVMQPIRALLGPTRRVLLSPDGALTLVPFGALVDEQGRYLIERYAFTYLTSGRDLLRLAVRTSPRQRALVVANPDFDSAGVSSPSSGERGQRSADIATMSFDSLSSTEQEGQRIGAHLAGARVLLRAAATEAEVKAARGPSVLHLATHGFFLRDQEALHAPPPDALEGGASRFKGPVLQIENPLLRSGLALAGANTRQSGGDDGLLTALEASQLDLAGTQLVVLSACETGLGRVRDGDGVYGLRRALVMAGAETQVMSLWKVDDAVTRDLMVSYYDKLGRGGGRSEAMRQEQLALLGNADRAHPYYWASFIVSGSGAALDGRAVAPSFAKVSPGLRGCGCEVDPRAEGGIEAWGVALFSLGLASARRRRRGVAGVDHGYGRVTSGALSSIAR
jgi:MYXO-CTERM domain-containing protein